MSPVALLACRHSIAFFFFFFNDTATTEIYTLSLHDALPILSCSRTHSTLVACLLEPAGGPLRCRGPNIAVGGDRESTRLNSSHSQNSYSVFFFKKKKKKNCS